MVAVWHTIDFLFWKSTKRMRQTISEFVISWSFSSSKDTSSMDGRATDSQFVIHGNSIWLWLLLRLTPYIFYDKSVKWRIATFQCLSRNSVRFPHTWNHFPWHSVGSKYENTIFHLFFPIYMLFLKISSSSDESYEDSVFSYVFFH